MSQGLKNNPLVFLWNFQILNVLKKLIQLLLHDFFHQINILVRILVHLIVVVDELVHFHIFVKIHILLLKKLSVYFLVLQQILHNLMMSLLLQKFLKVRNSEKFTAIFVLQNPNHFLMLQNRRFQQKTSKKHQGICILRSKHPLSQFRNIPQLSNTKHFEQSLFFLMIASIFNDFHILLHLVPLMHCFQIVIMQNLFLFLLSLNISRFHIQRIHQLNIFDIFLLILLKLFINLFPMQLVYITLSH